MCNFLNKPKIQFKLNDEKHDLNLTKALAGEVGTVYLGEKSVGLWTVNNKDHDGNSKEIVCDVRFAGISEALFEDFIESTKGRFLPAHFVLFKGSDTEKINLALEYFDYVLIPSKKLKNTPEDFSNRVLGYTE